MQREHLVVGFAADEITDRAGQLGADHPSKSTTNEIKDETRNQVLKSDHLVIEAEAEIFQPTLGLQPLWFKVCG